MDSSPSSASPSSSSWLAFSLSNNTHFNQTSNPSSLSLFQPFHPSQPFNTSSEQHQDGSFNGGCGEESFNGGLDLSMFSGSGPKLEDFLGTGCGSDLHVGQFSGENQAAEYGGDEELKSIAASFLRGYSSMNDQIVTECENNNNNNNAAASAAVVAAAAAASAAAAMAVVPVVESPSAKKAVDTFGQRTSIYRGVTRHRWTGRYEAHLWDNSCRREGQSRKGRQVYLGGYDKEDKAARAYDLAALKYWGTTTTTNFPVTNYEKELEEMKNMSRQEFVASLRRKSSGFSRGASIYRGVTRHHQHGRWQARIGRVAGNKDLYLGTFSTQEEAAEAYDIAAIKFRGLNAVTNFDMSRYDVKSIANSNLPIGGLTGKSKLASSESHSDNKSSDGSRSDDRDLSSVTSYTSQPSSSTTTLNFAMPIKQDPTDTYWSSLQVYPNHPTTAPGPTAATTATHHHNKNTMFQSAMTSNGYAFHGLSNLNMDFSNGGYVHHQQQQQQIPFGTPMSVVPSNSYESSSSPSYGNWVTPSGHVFQSAKPNISVFQTPIYGME